jgi:3-oxoacyl-[acyl-carrier-protein] synthase II
MKSFKRVVVTGIGALTPIGNTVPEYWEGLKNGVSGCDYITKFDAEKFRTRFACELKNFDITQFIPVKDARRMDQFTQYGIVASDEAIKDSSLDLETIDKK